MNIRDLSYFVAVAELNHFGKAAEKCFVSQPTLSMQLRKLEDELGVALFERNNKRVFITPIGERVLQHAYNILNEIDSLKHQAKLAHDPFIGTLRLGVIPTLGPYLLPHVLAPIQKFAPSLTLHLTEEKTERLTELLHTGKLDAAILALTPDCHEFMLTPLFSESFVIAVPAKHPLSTRKRIKMEDFHGQTLLLLEEGHCLTDQTIEICDTRDLNVIQGFRATSLETLRHMVAANCGITLLPRLAANASIISRTLIKYIPFTQSQPKRDIVLIQRKNSYRQACCSRLSEVIIDAITPILKDEHYE